MVPWKGGWGKKPWQKSSTSWSGGPKRKDNEKDDTSSLLGLMGKFEKLGELTTMLDKFRKIKQADQDEEKAGWIDMMAALRGTKEKKAIIKCL